MLPPIQQQAGAWGQLLKLMATVAIGTNLATIIFLPSTNAFGISVAQDHPVWVFVALEVSSAAHSRRS